MSSGYSENGQRQAALFFGRLIGLAGVLSIPPTVIASLSPEFFEATIAAGFVGICLGIVAYYLGAERLGAVAAVGCMVAMLLGVMVSQGMIPGLPQSDYVLGVLTGPKG